MLRNGSEKNEIRRFSQSCAGFSSSFSARENWIAARDGQLHEENINFDAKAAQVTRSLIE